MKLVCVVVICLAVVASAHSNFFKKAFCNPNRDKFDERHAWFLSTIANGREQGVVWANDVQIITPDENLNYVVQLSRFTYFQDNFYNRSSCSFNSVQAWPRLVDGQPAWAVQEIAAEINTPYFLIPALDDDDNDEYEDTGVDNESPSVYDIRWLTPKLAESLFVEGTVRTQVALSDQVGCIAWKNADTNSTALFECLLTADPGQRRLYSLNVPIETVPGVKASTILGAWNTFTSDAVPAPPDVREAFDRYRAGTLPLLPDPAIGPQGPPVFLYVPENNSARRGVSEYNQHFNGITFPKLVNERLQKVDSYERM